MSLPPPSLPELVCTDSHRSRCGVPCRELIVIRSASITRRVTERIIIITNESIIIMMVRVQRHKPIESLGENWGEKYEWKNSFILWIEKYKFNV